MVMVMVMVMVRTRLRVTPGLGVGDRKSECAMSTWGVSEVSLKRTKLALGDVGLLRVELLGSLDISCGLRQFALQSLHVGHLGVRSEGECGGKG